VGNSRTTNYYLTGCMEEKFPRIFLVYSDNISLFGALINFLARPIESSVHAFGFTGITFKMAR
jgi:hypothetical protein